VRCDILDTGPHRRPRPEDRPPIVAEVGVLPRTHGSALFTRGETQAIWSSPRSAPAKTSSIIDALTARTRSVPAALQLPALLGRRSGPHGRPGRREIGHGKLAWRALRPCCRSRDFPYTIRVVSEITESNGSSSMATVCGGSLALMDAGVPLKRRSPASPWA
jgi:polyribonucleotide nucleotidyltransferase